MTHLLSPLNDSGISIRLKGITSFGYGGYFRIRLQSDTPGLADWTIKTDNRLELYQQLYDITYKLARDLAITPGGVNEPHPPAPSPDTIANIEPQKKENGTNSPRSLIKMRDIQPDMPVKVKLTLLIEHFRNTLPEIAELLMQDYRAKTGKTYTQPAGIITGQTTNGNGNSNGSGNGSGNGNVALVTRLDADVQTIIPHAADLIVDNRLKYGAIAKTARLLGVPNAGAGYARARDAAQTLLEHHIT